MRFGFLLRDIPNKDVPGQEPRRPLGRTIVNKVSYVSILSPSFNRLPHSRLDGDTRIGHAASMQKQTSASHVDDAQESLRALQESADLFPNSHLKSAVSSVSALLQTAKVEECAGFPQRCMIYRILWRVEQSKKEAQAWLQRSLKVLETLAEAVGHDPFNIPPVMLGDIRSFEEYVSETLVKSVIGIYVILHSTRLLLEIRTIMEPPTEQGRTSRLFRSNRHGICFNAFDKRLSELQKKFEEACSQRSGLDTPFIPESIGALRVLPNPYSHTVESKRFRRRFSFSGWKSRLDPISCADVASTTLRVLEKPVPILSGAVSGISALLDTVKVERYSPLC